MDVTKHNFESVAREIESLLPSATFVAIDEEMTGIRPLTKAGEEVVDDSTAARYRKNRQVASTYAIIQVGVCLFHEEPVPPTPAPAPASEGGEAAPPAPPAPRRAFVARPYNFFVFPEEFGGRNPKLVLETGAIEFNKRYKMDFNRWMYDAYGQRALRGVPYVDRPGEEALRKHLWADYTANRRPVVLTRPTDQQFLDKCLADYKAWREQVAALESGAPPPEPPPPPPPEAASDAGDAAPASASPAAPVNPREMVFPECNAFLRAALYQGRAGSLAALREVDPDTIAESRAPDPNNPSRKQIAVLRLTDEEKAERARREEEERQREFDARRGFRRIFTALAASRLPLIGHNCLYDLLFLYSHFEGPLPEELPAFKASLNSLFPQVYDTKFIATSDLFAAQPARFRSGTSLGDLHDTVRGSTTALVRLAPGFDRYLCADGSPAEPNAAAAALPHEAGYDAFMTGTVFAKLSAEFAPEEFRAAAENRLNLIRSLFAMNLAGDDQLLEKGGVLHVGGLPSDYTNGDVVQLFSESGASVRIMRIDEHSAFAVVQDASARDTALTAARAAVPSPGVAVKTLEEFFIEMKLGSAAAAPLPPTPDPADAAPDRKRSRVEDVNP
eukprot:tig00000658_g2905.t1